MQRGDRLRRLCQTTTRSNCRKRTVRRAPGANTPEFRIFFIANSANVTVSNLTIRDGRNYNSGAILNDGATLTVNNCVFTANSGGGYGGSGIMNDGSNANARLTVNNCLFDGNSAINIISHVPTLLRALRPQLASIESIVRNVQRAALDYVLHSELPPALRSRARRICATASSCPTGDSHRSGGAWP